jgi:hypothetical protein
MRERLSRRGPRLSRRISASLAPSIASTIKLTLTLPASNALRRVAQSFRQG